MYNKKRLDKCPEGGDCRIEEGEEAEAALN
jgi:hypothetical protein